MPDIRWIRGAAALATIFALAMPAGAQQNMDTVQVRSQKLADRVYVLFGAGGNIGLSVGDDGAFIVDDQFAPLSEKIKAAIAALTSKPLRFVVNTHWHGDHSGGNANFGRAGAVIVAQDNVRARLSVEQVNARFNQKTPPSPHEALPVITFAKGITLHLNGDSVRAIHVPNAHTDGDAIIHYLKSNVIHMGDTFFNGMYPYIDTNSGGSVDGMIAAADSALTLANADTKIIPGHGPVASKADLQEYRRVVAQVRDRVKALVMQGKSLTEVGAAKPSAEFDAKWGNGFMKPDFFLDVVYNDLKSKYGTK
jgi:cyclase